MTRFAIPTLMLCLFFFASQDSRADDSAIEIARTHLEAHIKRDFDTLATTYAENVLLLPGHEFLKDSFGLAGEGGRREAIEVARRPLIAAMREALKGRRALPAERIDEILESVEYEVMEDADGKVAPSDPVGTADGKLSIDREAGDVLVKAGPPEEDFVLFLFRRIEGNWQVVTEYLD